MLLKTWRDITSYRQTLHAMFRGEIICYTGSSLVSYYDRTPPSTVLVCRLMQNKECFGGVTLCC
jgi:hypothetical protein